jgi:hypothetical protein
VREENSRSLNRREETKAARGRNRAGVAKRARKSTGRMFRYAIRFPQRKGGHEPPALNGPPVRLGGVLTTE